MARLIRPAPVCPIHGKPTKRAECRRCNAAYMREYMWRRRQSRPDRELVRRARKRAADRQLPFCLSDDKLVIPPFCPVLGIPLITGGARSENSPSLDRIDPAKGYVDGNVRIISDKANRLKGARTLAQLQAATANSKGKARKELFLIGQYIEREQLLAEVMQKARQDQPGHKAWREVADFLEKVFSSGQLIGADDKPPVETNPQRLSDMQIFILNLVGPS